MADQANEVVNSAVPAGQQAAQPAAPVDQFKDLLSSIKTEDGRQKFNSVPDALKALPHANEHISRLEQEMKDLRAELEKRKTAEEIIERLKQQNETKATEATPQPSVDLSQIDSLIDNRINQKEQAKTAEQNINAVVSALSKTFGEKAEEVFYSKAAEAGLTPSQINDLAKSSPKAALKIAGIVESQSMQPAKTTSSVNTEMLGTNSGSKGPSTKLPPYPSAKQLAEAFKAAKTV